MKNKIISAILFLSCAAVFADSIIQPVSINQTAACSAYAPLQPVCIPGGSITGMTSYCWADNTCQTTAATGVGPGSIVPADISTTPTDNFVFPGGVTAAGRTITNQLFVETASVNRSSATWVTRDDLTNGYKVDISLDGYIQWKETSANLTYYLVSTFGTVIQNAASSDTISFLPGRGTGGANQIDSSSAKKLELSSLSGGIDILYIAGTANESSSTDILHSVSGTVAQSGTAGWTGFDINIATSTEGSGTNTLFDVRLNSVSKFNVSEAGVVHVSSDSLGGGTALLGAGNSPAITNSAPYTWIVMTSSDGSKVYVPAWK